MEQMKEDEALKRVLQKLGPKYEYIKFIGQGSFSKVYLLHHKILGQKYALKIMDSHYILQTLEKGDAQDIPHKFEMIKKRFLNEARSYSKIDHPNVVRIYDVDVLEDKSEGLDITYIIMQFVEGRSLKSVLNGTSPLAMDRIIAISKDILHAIGRIHKAGIVHRDIKPANIIIEKESNRAILIDFGLAKDINISESASVAEIEKSLGTPVYMSPDQFQIHSKIGPGIDIYAFGILLYEMLTGDVPFKGTLAEIIKGHLLAPVPDIREKNPQVPDGSWKIIKKALAKEPENRYQKTDELLGDLEKIENHLAAGKVGKTKEKENKLDGAEIGKSKRKIRKYFIYPFIILTIIIIAMAIYKFILSPRGINEIDYKGNIENAIIYFDNDEMEKANYHLELARKIKDTFETKVLDELIKLNDFLKSDTAEETKTEACQKFLNKYGNMPPNEVKKLMIKRVEKFLTPKYISDAEKYLNKGELKNAYDCVKRAKALGETQKTAELEDKIFAGSVYDSEYYYKEAKPRQAKENYLLAMEIKPGSNLQDLEKRMAFLESMPEDVRAVFKTYKNIEQNNKNYWETEFEDGIVMVYIPGDKDIPGYWLGKTEVSTAQYMKFVNETKSNEPEWNEAGSPYHLVTGRDNYYKNQVEDNFPIVGISWDNAAAYCQWLSGKTGLTFKLPTEAQWQKAAQGTDYRLYPWGFEKPGNNLANFFSPSGKTVKVDANPQGASPYGLLNMAGNVEEWCDNQVARGGSFYSNDLYIRCTSRSQYDRKERNHALGFRLCMVGR
jgi:tRNA A-37 threonylcarbamoyl transferase component Bud32